MNMARIMLYNYADDICLLAPSAIDLQRMLDVCFNFGIRNDITSMFNPIKSVCVVSKSKSNKLHIMYFTWRTGKNTYRIYPHYIGIRSVSS